MTSNYLLMIDSPANAICAPHFSAKSCQRGLSELNQHNLLLSSPAFQLLFTINRIAHVIEAFVVNQPSAMILAGKPFELAALVLQNSPVDIVGHSNVKSPGLAIDDIDPILLYDRSRYSMSF